jgi:hypothetical protein
MKILTFKRMKEEFDNASVDWPKEEGLKDLKALISNYKEKEHFVPRTMSKKFLFAVTMFTAFFGTGGLD